MMSKSDDIADSRRVLRVAVVACEVSGDHLGAGLIEALRELHSGASFFGMAGERMLSAGCDMWHSIDEVSVMGLAEVVPHLPRLLKLRKTIAERIIAAKPDVFIGIDSPDFNQPIARRVRAAAIPAVQYVAPQVWAWRQWRVHNMRRDLDRILCVLPFEQAFFAKHGIAADFVGHPLADAIEDETDRQAARQELRLQLAGPVIAILPGSRSSEVAALAEPFLATVAWLAKARSDLRFIVAVANDKVSGPIREVVERLGLNERIHLVLRDSRTVMAAADVVLTASGTATLEALLLKRPMVIAHRVAPLTYWLVRRLGVAKLENFSLPNLLAGESIVPEFVQRAVTPEKLGPAVLEVLADRLIISDWRERFAAIHHQLRRNASRSAAECVISVVNEAAGQ